MYAYLHRQIDHYAPLLGMSKGEVAAARDFALLFDDSGICYSTLQRARYSKRVQWGESILSSAVNKLDGYVWTRRHLEAGESLVDAEGGTKRLRNAIFAAVPQLSMVTPGARRQKKATVSAIQHAPMVRPLGCRHQPACEGGPACRARRIAEREAELQSEGFAGEAS